MRYLDYASTTPMSKEVLEAMKPYFREKFGNPSSFHKKGREASKALKEARKSVVKSINASSEREIIFTSGGTESVNLAVQGAVESKEGERHVITGKTEHNSVLESCRHLEKRGVEVTYLSPNKKGIVTPKMVSEALREETVLVSLMFVNNETGAVNPLKEISSVCGDALFHSDACQAPNVLNIDVEELGTDLLTLNGSKIYGPKACGVLYKKHGVDLNPILRGGGQEFGLRSGTEDVPSIVGFAKALSSTQERCGEEHERLEKLNKFLVDEVKKIPDVVINSHEPVPSHLNVSFEGVEGESLLLRLDKAGFRVSTGSACSSEKLEPSHVLKAMGVSDELSHTSLRVSMGRDTSKKDLKEFVKVLKEVVEELRVISPTYK